MITTDRRPQQRAGRDDRLAALRPGGTPRTPIPRTRRAASPRNRTNSAEQHARTARRTSTGEQRHREQHREQHAAREPVQSRARPCDDRARGRSATRRGPSLGSTRGRCLVLAHQRGERGAADRAGVELDRVLVAAGRAGPGRRGGGPCGRGRAPSPRTRSVGGSRLRSRTLEPVRLRARVRVRSSDAKHCPHHCGVRGDERPAVRAAAVLVRRGRGIHARRVPSPGPAEGTSLSPRPPGARSRAVPRSRARCATRSHPRAARLPHRRGAHGIAEQGRDGVRDRVRRRRRRRGCPVSPSTSASRAPARIAHHHRASARGGLDEHVPPALDLEPAEPRPARHREHVADRVVPGQIVLGDLSGEDHRSFGSVAREGAEAGLVRSAAHDQQASRPARAAGRRPCPGSARPGPCARRAGSRRRPADGRRPHAARGGRRSGRSGRNASTSAPGYSTETGTRAGHGGAHGPRDERAAHHRDPRRPRRRVAHQAVRARHRSRASTRTRARRPGTGSPGAASRGPSIASG